MKIAINAIPYTDWQGIETFLAGFLRAWPEDERDEITVFVNQKSNVWLSSLPGHIRLKLIEFKKISRLRLFLYQQFFFFWELKKIQADILVCPSLISPWFYRRKVVIIHDLAPLTIGGESNRPARIFWQSCLWAAKYLSRGIITISEFSRQEISRYLKIDANEIINISEACPDLPTTGYLENDTAIKKFGLEKKAYFIYIGNVRTRKNLKNMILAWQKFNGRYDNRYYLVVSGRDDSHSRALQAWIKERQIKNIIFTAFVTAAEKAALLKKSLGLLFVSAYEGFGLPILEAQNLDLPVITANTSALPETAGAGGALFADPDDVQEMAEKIDQLAHDETLRKRLIAQGRLNVQKYSWTDTARKLRAALDKKL